MKAVGCRLVRIERAMEEALPGAAPAPQTFGETALAGFLQSLHADGDAAAREYERLRAKLTGYFAMRGDADPESGADETLDRASAKIAAGAAVPDVGRFCLGIARLVALERYRRAQRERQAFTGFAENRENRFDEEIENTYKLMALCLEQLPAAERELLTEYCRDLRGQARARQRGALAEKWDTTTLGLRLRVHRLRQRLADCVRKKLQNS
jgi:DNA-directed RNA polymerase specialized sigma24 family protein